MKSVIAIALTILTMVSLTSGCNKGNGPDPFVEPAQLMPVTAEEFGQIIDSISPDSIILVEQNLVDLVPKERKAFPFLDIEEHSAADERPNPAEVTYLISGLNLSVRFLMSAPGPVFVPVAATEKEKGTLIYLAKRTAPITDQLSNPITGTGGLDEMAKVGKGEGAFFIGKYEVTNARFAAFLNEAKVGYDQAERLYAISNPTSAIVHFQDQYKVYKGWGNLPVYNVSQVGAQAFCEHNKMSLPSLEQFKTAGGYNSDRKFPWGNDTEFHQSANLAGSEDGFYFLAPVNAYPKGKSPGGVYNLSGNVYEWLQGGALAGGSWVHGIDRAALDFSDNNLLSARNLHDGFRCVARQ